MKQEKIIWKFQSKTWKFGFVIPDDRSYYWWDFFVNIINFNHANDWDKVEALEIENSKWKKPEAKIVKVINWTDNQKKGSKEVIKIIEGIYTWWNWNFWFIDVEWQKKWYFVYWDKKNWAIDWDKVKAEVIMFKGKEEAIVKELLWQEVEIIEWIFKDNDRFWFVIPDDKSGDIFIAGSRKWEASNWDKVNVKIIKKWWKNPEWVIVKVL